MEPSGLASGSLDLSFSHRGASGGMRLTGVYGQGICSRSHLLPIKRNAGLCDRQTSVLVSVAQTCSRAADLTYSLSFIVRTVGALHNSGEFLGQMPGRFLGRVFLCGVE